MLPFRNEIVVPDDKIYMDKECRCKLLSLWTKDGFDALMQANHPYCFTPTDLIEQKTIPLPHIFFETEYGEFLVNTYENGVGILTPKLTVFCEYKEHTWEGRVWNNDGTPFECDDQNLIDTIVWGFLNDWYGVQVLLLNPICKSIMKNPVKEKMYTRVGTGKDRKRVVKYVRKHYITAEGIDEALYGHGHRDFERKTMAWYVIGHWRQYKNGTRKFINGYWKGPLREMKRNLDGGRVRQLAIQEV